MKKYIITSNKYSFCLDGLQKQMDKYWPSNEFTILGFKKPKVKLNKNFNFELLGSNLSDNTPWYKAITPYFEKINEEHFFLAFEDHFLIDFVNVNLFNEGADIIKKDKTIGKIRLLPKYNKIDSKIIDYNENFYESIQKKASYTTTSLRPSIWRKSLFNKLLKNQSIKTPHQFETANINGVFNERILLPKGNYPIFPDLDAMRQGRPNKQADISKILKYDFYSLNLKKEDLNVFNNVKKIWNNGV
jgi:hypothetical protein